MDKVLRALLPRQEIKPEERYFRDAANLRDMVATLLNSHRDLTAKFNETLAKIDNLDMTERWLSITAASKYASMCDKNLIKYVLAGQIYGVKIDDKWRLDKCSIDTFMTKRKGSYAPEVQEVKDRLVKEMFAPKRRAAL